MGTGCLYAQSNHDGSGAVLCRDRHCGRGDLRRDVRRARQEVLGACRSFDGLQPVTETEAYAIGQRAMTAGVRISAYSVSDYRGLYEFYVIHAQTQINCVW